MELPLTLAEYQERVTRAWIKDPEERGYLCPEYCALALAGEAGEIANLIKKHWRANGTTHAPISDALRDRIKDELGDALWYVQELSLQAGLTLEDVAQGNLLKLLERGRRQVPLTTI